MALVRACFDSQDFIEGRRAVMGRRPAFPGADRSTPERPGRRSVPRSQSHGSVIGECIPWYKF